MFPHKETITFCIIKNRATCYTTCFQIPANAQIHIFAASGGVCRGVCNTLLPYYKNGIHKIRIYSGRCVLHTPPERFRRKRRGVPMHKNDHSPPPAEFVRRMLLRLYRVTGMESEKWKRPYTIGKSEIKKQERIRYPCRGVLHTPPKYSIKEHSTLHK